MNTIFLLLARYDAKPIIPLETVRADYFSHLSIEKLNSKLSSREIDIPVVRMEESQKSARGIHINDLATYLDARRAQALEDQSKKGQGK